MTGNTSRAKSLAQDLRRSFPLGTQIQSPWLSAIETQLAVDRKNLAYVLNDSQVVSPIEFGTILIGDNIAALLRPRPTSRYPPHHILDGRIQRIRDPQQMWRVAAIVFPCSINPIPFRLGPASWAKVS